MTGRRISSLLLMVLLLGMSLVSKPQTVRASQRQIPQHEYHILEALYAATNGETWHDAWEFPTDIPCALYGVTCARGHIARLDLGANNLRGTIPAALGDLVQLRALVLSENELEGPIPTGLSNLGTLEHLILSDNGLKGPIPRELGDLNTLLTLALDGNALTGRIPPDLGRLNKLERLDLSHNQLCGPEEPAPESTVDLPNQDLTDGRPGETSARDLPGLHTPQRHLVAYQPSRTILPDLEKLGSEALASGRDPYEGAIPIELTRLANLQHLDLSYNQLRGPLPAELASLTQLRHLCLTNNQISGSIPTALGDLDELRHLGLASNHLTGEIPPELANLLYLEELSLLSNQLEGSIPPELGSLTHLRRLSLQFNRLTGPIPHELGQLRRLQHLDLRGNLLEGAIPPTLGNLADLRDLRLRYNSLRGPLPHSISDLSLLGVQLYSAHTPDVCLGNNQLWTHDPGLESFVASKDANWCANQNVAVAHIDPEQAGVIQWEGVQGQAVTIVVPSGAVTEPTTMAYYPLPEAADLPGLYACASHPFDLQAYRDGQPLAEFALREPVMVTLLYTDEEAADLDEATLKLYVHRGERWMDAALTCGPSAYYHRDPAANLLRLEICHFSSFALAGVPLRADDGTSRQPPVRNP